VFYVDELLKHSKSFEEHLTHLDIVIRKLTKAGFTLNAAKCRFCRDEVKLLDHHFDRTGVPAVPDRVAAILNCLAPRNSKQLRQFLGMFNFHSRFVADYTNHVASLLPLLKKGTKWEWMRETPEAFVRLRESFVHSIHLVHPREELSYTIHRRQQDGHQLSSDPKS
jgi:hypothetical protein